MRLRYFLEKHCNSCERTRLSNVPSVSLVGFVGVALFAVCLSRLVRAAREPSSKAPVVRNDESWLFLSVLSRVEVGLFTALVLNFRGLDG